MPCLRVVCLCWSLMTTIIKSLLNICLIAATGVGNCEVRTPDDPGSTPRQPSLIITMALGTLGFADKQDSGNMWLVLLLIALTIDNQHSIFNIRVSFASEFGCFYGQRRTNTSIKVTYISLVLTCNSPAESPRGADYPGSPVLPAGGGHGGAVRRHHLPHQLILGHHRPRPQLPHPPRQHPTRCHRGAAGRAPAEHAVHI